MELTDKIKRFENLHIFFWLIKDTCWMLEYKLIGALMIIPTIAVAIYIVMKTRRTPEVFINLAVFCWISANSFWMLMEFFNHNLYKNYSLLPFGLGFFFVALYYRKRSLSKS